MSSTDFPEASQGAFWTCTHTNSQIPERATWNSAGYDLLAREDKIILPGEYEMIGTGLAAKFRKEQALLILPRSSHPKHGLEVANSPGLVDADYYPNEIKVLLRNTNETDYYVETGQKIAQALLIFWCSFSNEIPPTVNRSGGFGSTDT